MLKLRKVAVTGGIAAGKTTVCRIFQELGAYVVSADDIVHQLLIPSTKLGKELVSLLGEDMVAGDKLKRESIAQKVFSDSTLLTKLEKLLHPEVQKEIDTQYQKASQKHYPLFVVEIPLLFEGNFEKYYDTTIIVVADEESCRKRFRLGKDEYNRRNQRLIPMEEKKQRADIVIENNGSLEDLYHLVKTTFKAVKEIL